MAKFFITNKEEYIPPRNIYTAYYTKVCEPPKFNDTQQLRREFKVIVEGENQISSGNLVYMENTGELIRNKIININNYKELSQVDPLTARTYYTTDIDGKINKFIKCDKNGNILNND